MSIDGIDILWVVDRSGSMNRFNAELLAGVEAMLLALPVSDWRLVMISADPRKSVVSTEFPLVPGDDIDDAAAMLATLTSAPYEEGFNSVYDYINLKKGAIVKIKDPIEYLKRLEFHNNVKNYQDYFF